MATFQAINQSKEASNQTKIVTEQTQRLTGIVDILIKTQIPQFADRAIWTYSLAEGGDYSSYENLVKIASKYPEQADFVNLQVGRVKSANSNLDINVDDYTRLVCWNPMDGQPQYGCGVSVPAAYVIGLMKGSPGQDWRVRAGAAKLLKAIPSKGINNGNQGDTVLSSEREILMALADRMEKDPSLGVRLTALRSFVERCKKFQTNGDYNFKAAIDFELNNCQ